MWTETNHRFVDEAAFLAASDAAGWARGPDGKALLPAGCAMYVRPAEHDRLIDRQAPG